MERSRGLRGASLVAKASRGLHEAFVEPPRFLAAPPWSLRGAFVKPLQSFGATSRPWYFPASPFSRPLESLVTIPVWSLFFPWQRQPSPWRRGGNIVHRGMVKYWISGLLPFDARHIVPCQIVFIVWRPLCFRLKKTNTSIVCGFCISHRVFV